MNAPSEIVVKPAPVDIAGMPAGQMMLVPTTRLIAGFMAAVPPGETVTVIEMRRELARRHEAEVTCPIYTGYHLRTVAEAALEAHAAGVPVAAITPFWRVLDEASATTGAARRLTWAAGQGVVTPVSAEAAPMSDTYLILIPTDPTWQPDAEAAQKAGAVVAELAPDAEDIEAFAMDEVEFFDAGENFESAKCPHCGADLTEWWPEAMDRAHELSFGDLGATMPCCGRPASLNDLVYDMPQGFAQFAISVTEPGIDALDGDALRKVGEALGHPVRAIWQRVEASD